MSFINGEVLSILSSPEFFDSFDCLLGFVDMPETKLPDFGLVPGLPGLTDLFPDFEFAEMAAKLAKLKELIDDIVECSTSSTPILCFSENCGGMVTTINKIFGTSLDCRNELNPKSQPTIISFHDKVIFIFIKFF